MIVALAGGVGAARFLDGLSRVLPAEELIVIGNTGDDAEIHGLHVSPDLDTIMYTLSGLANSQTGWGVKGDTFRCLGALETLGAETWFQLGDLDLATHIYRTALLRAGTPLSSVTRALARRLGVRATILPMCDEPVRTVIRTRTKRLEFQTYFVKRRARDRVLGVEFAGARNASPAPGVLQAIRRASAIVICPSNPIISIGPILAVPGLRDALANRSCPAIAITPIVGGRALKGPAARMMKSMGLGATALGVAELYRDLVDAFVLDLVDERLAPAISKLNMRAVVTNTIMSDVRRKRELARVVVQALGAV